MYTRPGQIVSCCIAPTCHVLQNTTTEQTLLLNNQKKYIDCITKNTLDNTLNNILQNENKIQTNITAQLSTYAITRNNKYNRLPPPFIPPSVIKLQMETATVGIPKTIVEPCSGK
jgi:hypothetical protein